jgi:predicted transcriptional regulator
MQPAYAERVFARTKHVEIRKKFSLKWKGFKAVVYGSQPLGALMGEVTVSNVISGSPAVIWEQYGARAGCSHKEFVDYVGSSKEVYALELADITPYISPVGIPQISHLISAELRPPQSFLEVKNDAESAWSKAISVAGLLHSRFGVRYPNL